MSPHVPSSGRRWRRVAIVVVVAVAAFAYGASVLPRPAPQPPDAPAAVFSAERAMTHVRTIAKAPHPAGSRAMAEVARYLADELERLGLDVRPLVARDPDTGVTLRIVAGRLRGRDPTGAVLFVAHPDSVPYGPGAGDNASGAAVLLETARALTAGPRARNDAIFLFDDGEELGDYRGGHLFADRHPWMSDIKLVVGLDTAAWGVPSLMQDSPNNGALVRGYATGVAHPVAFGFDASTNRHDDAEIDVFRRRGIPGIEFEDTYADVAQHTAGDTVHHVDLAGLQAMGDQVLGVAKVYRALDLAHASAPDRAFFSLAGIGLVHYPAWWSVALGVLAVAAVVAVLSAASRRMGIQMRRVAIGFAVSAGVAVAAAVIAKIAAAVYERWYPDPREHPLGEYLLPSSAPFAIVALLLIGIAFALTYRSSARRLGAAEIGLGFLVLWLVVSAIGFLVNPVGAYLFQWPLLVASGTWVWLVRRPGRDSIALAVPSAVALALLAPQALLPFFADGVAGLPGLALLATLAMGFLAPALTALQPRRTATRTQRASMAQVAGGSSAANPADIPRPVAQQP